MDGDPDLDDSGDTGPNGDELDCSGYEAEPYIGQWTGAGVAEAKAMIDANPRARLRPPLQPVPLVYYFAGLFPRSTLGDD